MTAFPPNELKQQSSMKRSPMRKQSSVGGIDDILGLSNKLTSTTRAPKQSPEMTAMADGLISINMLSEGEAMDDMLEQDS